MTTHLKKLKESYCQRQVCETMIFFKKEIKTQTTFLTCFQIKIFEVSDGTNIMDLLVSSEK